MTNTATPFHVGRDILRNPRDFCFAAAAAGKIPELTWFNSVDAIVADQLIKAIKR